MNKTKSQYVHKGLAEVPSSKYIAGQTSHAFIQLNGTEENKVTMSTIDIEAIEKNMTVGLIKADTERYSLPIIRGAIETIKRDRPVVLIHCYHSYNEYYKIPRILREIGNYIFMYRADNNNPGAFFETAFIAIPGEALYPRYNNYS